MRAGLLDLEFSSHPRNIARLEGYVQKMVETYKITPNKYGDILISLTEAVNNAIIHGNHKDESKKVKIHLKKLNNKLAIRVSDQGRGFDLGRVPDPTCPDNLERCGGRGVFLMQQLSDKLQFEDNGRTVEMQFRLR